MGLTGRYPAFCLGASKKKRTGVDPPSFISTLSVLVKKIESIYFFDLAAGAFLASFFTLAVVSLDFLGAASMTFFEDFSAFAMVFSLKKIDVNQKNNTLFR